MQYIDFRQKLKEFTIFSLSDIRKIEADFDLRRLSEWQKKGYIKKLRRGYYIFSGLAINEQVLFLLANKLYAPSYVSLESALSQYELIPEGVYTITSVCSRKTARFATPLTEFSYRSMRPELLFGYSLQKCGEQLYKIAEIEKTVLDYLYFHPDIVREADFYEWRFNSEEFLSCANMQKLQEYARAFQSKQLLQNLEKLLKLIQQAQ